MSVVMPGCISRQFARGVGRSGRKQPRIVVLSSSLFRFALLVKRTELRAVRIANMPYKNSNSSEARGRARADSLFPSMYHDRPRLALPLAPDKFLRGAVVRASLADSRAAAVGFLAVPPPHSMTHNENAGAGCAPGRSAEKWDSRADTKIVYSCVGGRAPASSGDTPYRTGLRAWSRPVAAIFAVRQCRHPVAVCMCMRRAWARIYIVMHVCTTPASSTAACEPARRCNKLLRRPQYPPSSMCEASSVLREAWLCSVVRSQP